MHVVHLYDTDKVLFTQSQHTDTHQTTLFSLSHAQHSELMEQNTKRNNY